MIFQTLLCFLVLLQQGHLVTSSPVSSSSSSHSRRTCKLVIVADSRYVESSSTSSSPSDSPMSTMSISSAQEAAAYNSINVDLENAAAFYGQQLGLDIQPMVISLLSREETEAAGLGATTNQVDNVLDRFEALVKDKQRFNQLVWKGNEPTSSSSNQICGTILLTAHPNLGKSLGISETASVCNPARNTGLINVMMDGKRISETLEVATFLHELGHMFGASHDKADVPIDQRELMHPIVSEKHRNLFKLSDVALASMRRYLDNHQTCLINN